MVFQTEKSMNDLGDKIDSADRSELDTKLAALKEALKGSDLEDIKTKQEDLKNKFYEVSAKVYQNVNPQAGTEAPGPDMGAGAGPDAGASGNDGNDGYVDADFKEV